MFRERIKETKSHLDLEQVDQSYSIVIPYILNTSVDIADIELARFDAFFSMIRVIVTAIDISTSTQS